MAALSIERLVGEPFMLLCHQRDGLSASVPGKLYTASFLADHLELKAIAQPVVMNRQEHASVGCSSQANAREFSLFAFSLIILPESARIVDLASPVAKAKYLCLSESLGHFDGRKLHWVDRNEFFVTSDRDVVLPGKVPVMRKAKWVARPFEQAFDILGKKLPWSFKVCFSDVPDHENLGVDDEHK